MVLGFLTCLALLTFFFKVPKPLNSTFLSYFNADIIFYNGLHLEGKLVAVFEKMEAQKTTVALGEFLAKDGLIGSDYFASNYDPHVWFNIQYFKQIR